MLNLFVSIVVLGIIAFILFWFFKKPQEDAKRAQQKNGYQEIRVEVMGGYTPETIILKKSQPARIIFDRKDPSPCLDQIVFPDFGGVLMQISDAEWQVMKIIWMQGEQTSTDLIKVLEKTFSWSKSTIQTLLARLVEKECLTREKQGKSFVYSSLLTPDDSRGLMVQDIKDKLCSRRIKLLLADLIEECDFTLADLEGLEEVISKKKASAVTEVRCNCM